MWWENGKSDHYIATWTENASAQCSRPLDFSHLLFCRGNTAVDIERNICVVDNVARGFNIYTLDTGSFVRTLEVGLPTKTYGKGIVFANGFRAVVAGSDHGQVYIFNHKSGAVLKKIYHSKSGGGWKQ